MRGKFGCGRIFAAQLVRCECRHLYFAHPDKKRFVSRITKAIVWIAAVLCLAVVVGVFLLGRAFGDDMKESVSETPVTSAFTSSMQAAGFPITVTRAVSASSHGGLHGDGQSLIAYRYSPQESAALIAAVQQKHPDFFWVETRSEFVARYSPWTLLPRELQPDSGASMLYVGRPKEGLPMQEYVVDRVRGVLYVVSNTF